MADVEAMFHHVSVIRWRTGMCYGSYGGLTATSLARQLSTR